MILESSEKCCVPEWGREKRRERERLFIDEERATYKSERWEKGVQIKFAEWKGHFTLGMRTFSQQEGCLLDIAIL